MKKAEKRLKDLEKNRADFSKNIAIITAIFATLSFIFPLQEKAFDLYKSVIEFTKTTYIFDIIEKIAPPIFLLIIPLIAAFGFGYLIYKISKIFEETKFDTVFFSKKTLFHFSNGWSKNKKQFIKRLILLTGGYSFISGIIALSILSIAPNPAFWNVVSELPIHIFFALGIIFAIRLLNFYKTDIAKNLFFTVLFGFFAISFYSILINPFEVIEKVLQSSFDIVSFSFIFALISDFVVRLYFHMKGIKRSLFNKE